MNGIESLVKDPGDFVIIGSSINLGLVMEMEYGELGQNCQTSKLSSCSGSPLLMEQFARIVKLVEGVGK